MCDLFHPDIPQDYLARSTQPECQHQERLQEPDRDEPGVVADSHCSGRERPRGPTRLSGASQDSGKGSSVGGDLFPPGPDDLEAWARVLAEMPEAEPDFCRDADGVAWWLDATTARTQKLRVLGNGVVPLVSAYAFRTLAARFDTERGAVNGEFE